MAEAKIKLCSHCNEVADIDDEKCPDCSQGRLETYKFTQEVLTLPDENVVAICEDCGFVNESDADECDCCGNSDLNYYIKED